MWNVSPSVREEILGKFLFLVGSFQFESLKCKESREYNKIRVKEETNIISDFLGPARFLDDAI